MSGVQDNDGQGAGEMPVNPYEDEMDGAGYGFEAPPALDSFTTADPYENYDLPALDCPYEAPVVPPPFDITEDDANLSTDLDLSQTPSSHGGLSALQFTGPHHTTPHLLPHLPQIYRSMPSFAVLSHH